MLCGNAAERDVFGVQFAVLITEIRHWLTGSGVPALGGVCWGAGLTGWASGLGRYNGPLKPHAVSRAARSKEMARRMMCGSGEYDRMNISIGRASPPAYAKQVAMGLASGSRPCAPCSPGTRLGDDRPETRGMVHLHQVRKFVDHDVIDRGTAASGSGASSGECGHRHGNCPSGFGRWTGVPAARRTLSSG